jgi:hypothetical protein
MQLLSVLETRFLGDRLHGTFLAHYRRHGGLGNAHVVSWGHTQNLYWIIRQGGKSVMKVEATGFFYFANDLTAIIVKKWRILLWFQPPAPSFE